MSDYSIRLVTRADAEDINGIQNRYVVRSTATFDNVPTHSSNSSTSIEFH